ncbi:hypothetical protein FQN54_001287 [Arachnomyces sp. PD_36]|nr:hypothetical protein FQN54_001287 [Arachnomyces sp. PD_36]
MATASSLTNSGEGQQSPQYPSDPALWEALMIPSQKEISSKESLFSSLASSLLGEQAARCKIANGPDAFITCTEENTLALVQVGLYGMGLWSAGDTMECLCIGTMSDDDFVNRARRHPDVAKLSPRVFRNDEESEDEVRLIISMQGVSINIQYCKTPAVENWDTFHSIPSSKLRAPPSIAMALNGYRDLQYICSSVPDLEAFKTAYRFIVRWALANGLFSEPLGYLDHSQILFMLNKAVKRDSPGQMSWSDIVRVFFKYYSTFPWNAEIVTDPITYQLNPGELPFNRGFQTPAAVLTINTPLTNVASSVSEYSLDTLIEGYKSAELAVTRCETEIDWLNLLAVPADNLSLAANTFINSLSRFVCFETQYWGPEDSRSSFYAKLDKEFISLSQVIKARRPLTPTRPWPKPFVERDGEDDNKKLFYLIGFEEEGTGNAVRSRRTPPMERVCRDFLEEFTNRGSADPTLSRVNISVIGRDALGDIVCDSRDSNSTQNTASKSAPEVSLDTGVTSGKAVSAKLRPASDILNRITWDPSFDRTSFIVGYEDRFLGSKELPLGLWRTDLTDEEFIPQHRILYFKRKGSGEVVWDRNKRIDRIFGSGNA